MEYLTRQKIVSFLDKAAFACMWLGLFIVPFKTHWVKVFFICSFGLFISARMAGRRKGDRFFFKKSYLDKPLVIFIALTFFANIFSGNFLKGQEIFFGKIMFYVLVYFLTKETITSRKRVFLILTAFILSAFAVGIDSLIQYFTGQDIFGYCKKDPGIGMVIALSGPFGSYNFFSGYLELILPFMIFLCFVRESKIFSTIVCVVTAILAFCWIYVFERTTWLSVFAGVSVIAIFFNRRFAPFILGIIIFTALLFPSYAWKRWASGDTGRIFIWRKAVELVRQNPVFGSGLGSFARYARSSNFEHLHVHNTYLEVILDTGIVGLSGFLYLLGCFLSRNFSLLAKESDRTRKMLISGFTASCASAFIAALFSTNMLVGIGLSALFWAFFSLSVILPDIKF